MTIAPLSIEGVGAALGLEPVPQTPAELDRVVRHGLPFLSLVRLAERFPPETRPLIWRFIGPRSTIDRREASGWLSGPESERLARLTTLTNLAHYVWQSAPEAQAFLATPHPQLEQQSPLEVAETEIGARRVEDLLWSLEYGLPA